MSNQALCNIGCLDDPAKPRPQELELAPGALELVRVGIAADHDGGALRQAQVALAQPHAVALGEPDELGDGPMQQPRVGRMRDRLRLHRGIDHHPFQVPGTDRARLVRHRQAFLDQRDELLLAEPLAPARHRRAIERQPVAKAQLAAEVLVIGVLDPAGAQHLIRKVVHVLENEQAGDQPRRQPRLPRPGLAHRAKAAIQEGPVDQRRQPHQRVAHVDDLIEGRKQQVFLPIIPRLAHRLPQCPTTRRQGITNRSKAKSQNAGKRGPTPRFPAKANTLSRQLLPISQADPHFFTDDHRL